jgi:cysteine-rich repeat protein
MNLIVNDPLIVSYSRSNRGLTACLILWLTCSACQTQPDRGSAPQALLTPSMLNIGAPSGNEQSVRSSLSVDHIGGTDLIILDVELIEYDSILELSIIDKDDWQNRRIDNGKSERIEVEWTPRDAQSDRADLIFTTNIGQLIAEIRTADLDASLNVSISGEWLAISGSNQTLEASFEGVVPSGRGDALVRIESLGFDPLEIMTICLANMETGCLNTTSVTEDVPFQLCDSVLSNGCAPIQIPQPLVQGESHTISVRYLAPERQVDSHSVQLLIMSNSADSPRLLIQIKGTPCIVGVNAEECNFEFCGDGVVQEGEACDDGDEDEGNGCNTACELNRCGDGVVHRMVEECDDSNDNNNDDCLNTCVAASCGDGYLWAGHEVCDDGDDDNNNRCLVGCTLASCGDGFTWAGVESCDDANQIDDDECSNVCEAPTCGDGLIQSPSEMCDDGDDNGGVCAYGTESCLGCSEQCETVMQTGRYCGDGIMNGPETCDDGNQETEACDYGLGVCMVCDELCRLVERQGGRCGDGLINGTEECDGQFGCEETCILRADAPTCAPYCPELDWRSLSPLAFEMGYENGTLQESPTHQVTVDAFEMTRSEVTVSQYTQCVNAEVCTEPRNRNDNRNCNWGTTGRDQYPLNCVTWYQARTFAQWVGGDLPSEVQWERAARGADGQGLYPWSSPDASPSPSCEYAIIEEAGTGCGLMRTWPVCQKPQGESDEGICDLLGNVWEWTLDAYQPYTISPRDDQPRCLALNCTGEPMTRTLRGGGWIAYTPGWRATIREGYPPLSALNFFGFRVARPPMSD